MSSLAILADAGHDAPPLRTHVMWRQVREQVHEAVGGQPGFSVASEAPDCIVIRDGPPLAMLSLARKLRQGLLPMGGQPGDIALRFGLHAHPVPESLDADASELLVARRLASLAEAGGLWLSAQACDGVSARLDAELEDQGEASLRVGLDPCHVFRVLDDAPGLPAERAGPGLLPCIAVLPLRVQGGGPQFAVAGDLFADAVITGLSRSSHLRIITRLSSAAFRNRQQGVAEIGAQLGASYLLRGQCSVGMGQRLFLELQFFEVASGRAIWAERLSCDIGDLLRGDTEVVGRVVEDINALVVSGALRAAQLPNWDSVQDYSLLLAGITQLHKLSPPTFRQARVLLEHVHALHPQAAEPLAWLAKWHVMSVAQGWMHADEGYEAAHAATQAALHAQPEHALSLAMDGLVEGFLRGELETAQLRYEAALQQNPSEALAWLFKSALLSYQDQGQRAAEAAAVALSLSPLDPWAYYYDAFAANAMLAAGRLHECMQLAQRSIRARGNHYPIYRALAIAQVFAGQLPEARQSVQRLLKLNPSYSLHEFRQRYAGRHAAHADGYAQALREAGLPEH